MASCLHLGLLVCLASLVLGSPFPPSREVKFTYHADVQVGTEFPSSAISQFSLHGMLKVQSTDDLAVLQLADLTTSLYNGPHTKGSLDSPQVSPIPDEAGALSHPFTLQFKDGGVVGLLAAPGEAEWSVNIKRALANLLQLDINNLDNPAFITKENGLYGSCDAEYTIRRQDESYLVRKFIDHSTCLNFPSVSWTNTPPVLVFCPSGQDDFLTSTSERIYVLNANKNIMSIVANGGVYNQPFRAQGELQYMLVNQTLVYESESIIATPTPSNVGSSTDLLYRLPGKEFSQGRNPLKQTAALNIIKRLLAEISDNLERPPTRNPDKLHDERISHAIYFMTTLELATLEKYFDELAVGTSYHQETLRKLFMELLPKVGTSDSTLLVCDLVAQGRISNREEAVRLITLFPFYIREPSEEILQQCEIISSLPDDKGAAQQQAGVLSFATLVHKICKQHCSPETQETYVRKYLDRFTGATSYGVKMLYLEGLSNIEDGKVFEYLEPVIKEHSNVHLRFLAVWATMNVAAYHPDQVYKLYWPILANTNEPLEMRVAALTMLVISKPPTGRLFSLHWFMNREKEPRLKHFYYTTLQSLVNTKDPCYSLLSGFAARVLRLLPPPPVRHWATGNYVLDHASEQRGFGAMAQLFLVGNPVTDLPNVFFLKLSSFGIGMQLNHISLYLKLSGVARAVKDRLARIDPNNVKIKQLAEILRDIKAAPNSNEEVHLEMLIKTQDRVITSLHLNESIFHLVADALPNIFKSAFDVHHNIVHMDSDIMLEKTIPSDLGIAASTYYTATGLTTLRGNDTRQVADSRTTVRKQLELRRSITAVGELEFYNPLMDVWQGVSRSTTVQMTIPIDGSLKLDTEQNSLKFNVVRRPDVFWGVVAHLRSSVFLSGEESTKKLQNHCPSCRKMFTITRGDRYKRTQRFLDVEVKDIGAKLQGEVFDCEHHVTLQALESVVRHQNYHVFPLSRPFVALAHTIDSWLLFAPPGSCGTEVQLMTIGSEATQLEGSIQVSSVGPKTLLSVSLVQKSIEKTLYEWDLNAACQRDGALFNLAVNIIRDAPATEDFRKLCLDASIQFPAAPSDKYLIKPSKPLTADITMNWAAEGGSELCGGEPANKLPFQVRIVAETLPEQEQMAAAAITWPFDACKRDNNTHACYSAAREMATLRKYSIALNYSQPIDPELMFFARTSDGRLLVSAEVSPVDPVVYLTLGSDRFKVDTPRYWLDPLLLNTHYSVMNQFAMSLGLIKPGE